MKNDPIDAVTRVGNHAVPAALQAALAALHEHRRAFGDSVPTARFLAAATPAIAPVITPGTWLEFEIDHEAKRLIVQVVDRESGAVVRSFPLVLPGLRGGAAEETARGVLVDAKA
jgi:hypothetical protein